MIFPFIVTTLALLSEIIAYFEYFHLNIRQSKTIPSIFFDFMSKFDVNIFCENILCILINKMSYTTHVKLSAFKAIRLI